MRDQQRILIVHPEPSARALMGSMLQSLGPRVDDASSDRAAVRRLDQGDVALIVAAVDPFDPEALELLQYVRRKSPAVPVVVLLTVPHAERAREALQRGAASVLKFPLPATQLRAAVAQALGRPDTVKTSHSAPSSTILPPTSRATGDGSGGWTILNDESTSPAAIVLNGADAESAGVPDFVGEDTTLRQALELAEGIAASRSSVLIQGERGTGKSLLARSLHQHGPRSTGPFFEVDCASMRETAMEVELFGRRCLGLVGTLPDETGKVAMAHGGTLYLDNVGSLSPELQYKLLRLLQEGEYEPVGSTQTCRVDVRLVFGSREDLSDRVERDEFRQDLFYRIGVVCLKLPPLRHRGSDIQRLADHFLDQHSRELGRQVTGFSPEAVTLLRHYEWPGNVQELELAIERGIQCCRGSLIAATDLGLVPLKTAGGQSDARELAGRRSGAPGIRPLKEALEEPERRIILQALEALNWNRQETARLLDINRTTLYKKMKKYGLLLDEPAWAN